LEVEDAIGLEMDVAASKGMGISKQSLPAQIMTDHKQLENADI
jgi:hypothetical protein